MIPENTSLEKVATSEGDKILMAIEEVKKSNSLFAWMSLYYQVHASGGSSHTGRAKRLDLQKFLTFYTNQLGGDQVSYWTPSLSRAFQRHLQTAPRKAVALNEDASKGQKGRGEAKKPLVATSINRIMATLRHFASWLHHQLPFPTGHPFTGVKDITTDTPAWNGLSVREITRLKKACDQRLAHCVRKDQNPLLEVAVFYCLLYTGMRESELAGLRVAQYHSRGFHSVKRKGNKITHKIPLPAEARNWLDKYLEKRKINLSTQDPLFITRYGNGLAPKEIYRIVERICNQANAQGDSIRLTPHMLRHTFLKRVADKHGVHTAQDMSGNISMREIFRYTKPSQQEKDELAEKIY